MTRTLALLHRGILRPRDAEAIFTQPALQFRRLEAKGELLKVAHGYYVLIPESERGANWRPAIEAIALGIGQADYGRNGVTLMHLSAARIHGAIPRAIAVAVLAVPKQRPTLKTEFGRIIFVKRDVESLKRVRTDTEIGTGWVTSIEQTALDLAKRPELVSGMDGVSGEAISALINRVDSKKLTDIAESQRMKSALARIEKWK